MSHSLLKTVLGLWSPELHRNSGFKVADNLFSFNNPGFMFMFSYSLTFQMLFLYLTTPSSKSCLSLWLLCQRVLLVSLLPLWLGLLVLFCWPWSPSLTCCCGRVSGIFYLLIVLTPFRSCDLIQPLNFVSTYWESPKFIPSPDLFCEFQSPITSLFRTPPWLPWLILSRSKWCLNLCSKTDSLIRLFQE